MLGSVAGCSLALAQDVPKLDSLSATWFQRGTTNEVTVNGEAFAGINTLLFTGNGLAGGLTTGMSHGVSVEGSAGGITVGQTDASKALTVQVIVSGEAALGGHEVRVAGPNGVSNPLTINVSDLPELLEPKGNNQPTNAPWVTLPAAVSGIIGGSTEADYFRFRARAGEKLIFDVQANRFGSPLDPTLILLDAAGKEIARSEDANGLDPFLEFTAPAEGEYVAKLTDLRFQGGGDYRYRIVAGALPYLDFLFPFGGKRGTSVELQLQGRNLEGADNLTVQIAGNAPMGRQDIRAHPSRGYSNPQPFEAGDLPEFTEAEPNNANDKANAVTAPVVINGRIGEPNDSDVFRLKAVADQRLVIELKARQFGSPLDALLTLMDTNGAVLQRNDDANGLDARIEFDAKKDTDYLVALRDLTDRGGERFGYRMSVRPPNGTPDFTARVPGGRFRVNRGGSTAVRCEVDRRNGFDGLVKIIGEGLPAGVTASTLVLGSSPNFGWLILTATADAATGNFPLKLSAAGEQGGKALVHGAQFAEQGWLTVLPMAPFTVQVAQAAVITEQNAGVSLDVSVIRRDGFAGEIKVMGEGPNGVDIPVATIPPDQSRAKLALNAAYNAEAGTRPVLVRAEATVDGGTVVQYSATPATLTVQPIAMFLTAMLPGSPFFRTDSFKLSAVALPTNSASAANSTEFVVKVERRGLNGEIALALEGLPSGVAATVANIPADKNDATIRLVVSDQAETGKEQKFNVVGTATYNDRIWRQKTQPVTLMVAAPEKETAAVAPVPAAVPALAPAAVTPPAK
ncbi:MAG TPA: hypothetical protein VMB21_06465 [Candidatus Limnocylindria bacterium]|nr:hypothetical protein [Candidatus Limnocylindria bacterium]